MAKPEQDNLKSEADNEAIHYCETTKTLYHSKATYSAQHQAPNITNQQNCKTNTVPNLGTASYPCCNAVPLYDVSSKMTNKGQNIPMENATPFNNMQHSCPCSSLPPLIPPCNDDLWDLQFCRWWGWNWIRKREEMINQKKAEPKTKCDELPNKRSKSKKSQRSRKRGDFFTWCNKLFKKRGKDNHLLKMEEKKQLQELYDTPCSSVTFNKCPCPVNDWECRSLNLEGQYECYCSSTRQTSVSTVVVRNKTRRQTCKQNMRKRQSWVCEKTDSSSSDECCPCVCVCPQRESSTEESIEYLALRMAHMKSDGEENLGCPCTKLKQKHTKKNSPKNVCCHCKAQKKQETNVCCPCMVKLACEKRNNCACNKLPKQKCFPNIREQNVTKCNCASVGISKKNNLSKYRLPSPSRSLPVCQTSSPSKVPRFRRFPQPGINPAPNSVPENRRRPKRKNVDCCYAKRRDYVLCCPCKHQPKKLKKSDKPKKVYYCYCCCCSCNCCCCCINKSQPVDTAAVPESKSEKDLKQTSDKCIGSNSVDANLDLNINLCCNNNQPQPSAVKDANLPNTSPKGDYIQDNFLCNNSMQFGVSAALQKGLYTSPLTGRLYSLDPKVFTANKILNQSNLPKPLDIDHKILSINPLESPIADEEHKILLTAVCEAIMSSRYSGKKGQHQNYAFPSPNNNYWSNSDPSGIKNNNIYEHISSFDQRSVEVDIHDYGNDERESSIIFSESEDFDRQNFAMPGPYPPQIAEASNYKNILSPDILNVSVPNFGASTVSEHKNLEPPNLSPDTLNVTIPRGVSKVSDYKKPDNHDFKNFLSSDILKVTVPNFGLPEVCEYKNKIVHDQKAVNNISRKTRTPVRRGKHSPIKQQSPAKTAKPNGNTTKQPHERDVIHSEQINVSDGVRGLLYANSTSKNYNEDSFLANSYDEKLSCCSNLPMIQKSSMAISVCDSPESLHYENAFLPLKNNLVKNYINLSDSLIPFNSPRNWMNARTLPGLAVPGLFSRVSSVVELPSDSSYINGQDISKSTATKHFQRGRLYEMSSTDRSDYCEDCQKLPYKFCRIPTTPCMIRHPVTYPYVLQKLPFSDATEGTQTNQCVKKAPGAADKRYSEKQLQCDCVDLMKKYVSKNRSEKETSCKSLTEKDDAGAPNSEAAKTRNVLHCKSVQGGSSKVAETNDAVYLKASQANTSKPAETNSTVHSKSSQAGSSEATETFVTLLSEPLQRGTSKATDTNITVFSKPSQAGMSKTTETFVTLLPKPPQAGTSKATETNATVFSKSLQGGTSKATETVVTLLSKPLQPGTSKATETNITVFSKPSQAGTSKTTETFVTLLPKPPQAGTSKATETGATVHSKPSEAAYSKATVLAKPPQAGSSKVAESSSVFTSKLPRAATSKSTATNNQMKMKQAGQNISFTKQQNSEKEIGCKFFHEGHSKDFNCKKCVSAFNDTKSSPNHPQRNKPENKCLYLEHELQNLTFFADAGVKTGKSEKLLSVVNRMSEEHFSDSPFVTKNFQTHSPVSDISQETFTVSRCTNVPTTESQNLLAKSLISTTTSPLFVDRTTSPVKIKYTKVRAQDRPLPENYVREKVPKRESPFSMFCTPVASKNIAQGPFFNDETKSLSRPERQMVVVTPKKLKVREKRWRF